MSKPVQGLIQIANQLESDVGKVIKSGCELEEGDEVLVDPYQGLHFEDFEGFDGEIRLFGLANDVIDDVDMTVCVPIDEQIPAVLDEWVKPLGKKCLILRDSFQEKQNGVYLPFKHQSRTGKALILEVGDDVTEWEKGETVIYHGGALNWLQIADENLANSMCKRYDIEKDRLTDLALIYEEHIYLGIQP